MKKIYTLLLLLFMSAIIANAQIKYVSENGGGQGNDGNSWETAYDKTKLQQAINEAEASGSLVWVAKGTYTPTENLTGAADEDKSFILRNGVKIYGGFAGTEPGNYDLDTRDFINNETILSGDFGGGTNAHHVVVNIANISGVALDGFTVTGGNANGTGNAVGTVARNSGGGIFLSINSGIEFSNLIIDNNLADNYGGGIYLSYSGTEAIKFTNVKFIANTGIVRAGAIYLTRPSGTAYVDINNCTFETNGTALGGAIFNNSGELNIYTSTFDNCTGTNGGAINSSNTASSILFVKGCIFKNNHANNGAGIYHYTGTATVEETTFENNTTTARGAGIYLYNGSLTINRSTFDNNNATSDGGAIYRYGASAMDIDKSIFKNNISGANAGAVKAIFGITNIVNSIFYNNSAQDGGAVYIGNSAAASAATLIATNNTFYKNKDESKAGVISFLNTEGRTDIKLYNNILVGNMSTSGSADVRITTLETPTAVQNIPMTIESNLLQSTLISGENLVVANNVVYNSTLPLFDTNTTDPAASNFLGIIEGQATEAGNNAFAIDAGILSGTDLAGNNRLQHTNIDLGAYEYQGVLPVVLDYFKVHKENEGVKLFWKTFTEHENNYFIIERGSSSTNFHTLAKINANSTQTYTFTDKNPLQGVNYYRLVQYDFNGNHRVISEKSLYFSLESNKVEISPIPADNHLTISLPNEATGETEVNIISITGQELISRKYNIVNDQKIILDISDIKTGSYLLKIRNGNTLSDTKFFIKK